MITQCVAVAVRAEPLEKLVAHFESCAELLSAAEVSWAITSLYSGYSVVAQKHYRNALFFISKSGLATVQSQQLELTICAAITQVALGEEKARVNSRIVELLELNPALTIDKCCFGKSFVSQRLLCHEIASPFMYGTTKR